MYQIAGSDVANLRTEAKKTPCGKYYIVSTAPVFWTIAV
jgi:hypothetical protein